MNQSDLARNARMLPGSLGKKGYMRWWHSFSGVCEETGEIRSFFIEYFLINPALGGNMPILGQHPYYKKRGMKPSYAMIKVGAFPDANGQEGCELHGFYPLSSMKVASDPMYMQIDDCIYSENHIAGFVDVSNKEARHRSLMSDAGYMDWDLEVHKAVSCHTGILGSAFFTALGALQSFWHAEGIRTFYRGRVTLNGLTYQITPETCYGYADKHWGRDYNTPWFQLASSHLVSERTGRELKHSAFAIDGCSPKFLCFPFKRKLFIQLTYTGEDFEFSFAKPGSFTRSKWKVKETNKRFVWHITAQNKNALVRIDGCCLKELMIPLRYETPNGEAVTSALLGGSAGYGTIQIYRLIPGGKELLDTLSFENGLLEYQPEAQ